ncbi:hypothetical protein MCUN1_000855 [Malassezia cuniculi]|uniref:Uncharacterized protein n=1 Tax=Malassezia cuniculi TaxID=948313 RepID=A0AAF0EWG4_9BASI|nr:hypothetical protein MCUN1_000855 [Malassezia cuniculi]
MKTLDTPGAASLPTTPTLHSSWNNSSELSDKSSVKTPTLTESGSEDTGLPGNFPEHINNDNQQFVHLVRSINSIPSWLGLAHPFCDEKQKARKHDDPANVDYFNFKAPSSALRHVVGEEPVVTHRPAPDDDTWSIVSVKPSDIVENGMADSCAKYAPTMSVPLQELEKIELELFLKNFSRHTREVRMFGNETKATRMPQWSDFAYSSSDEEHEEEEETGHYISRVNDKPKRSRLLTHVDRGLQNMHEDAVSISSSRRSSSTDRLTRSRSSDRICRRPSSAQERLKRSNSAQSVPKRTKKTITTPQVLPGSLDFEDGDVPESKGEKHVRIAHSEEHVDGVAFVITYILALVEQFAPGDLDEAPITEYRESRARSHLERLYIIAPFWEQLEKNIRALYRWEQPRKTAAAAMIYFVLWYTDLIPAALILTVMYYVAQFRYMPPNESYLHRKVQERMERGRDADKFAERLKRRSRLDMLYIYKAWQNKYGVSSQIFVNDVADYHEKIKNLLLWRNPAASRRTLAILLVWFIIASTVPAAMWWKGALFLLGVDFFGLMALRSHYPRYRRPLNPLWWFVLGSPTDAQYAVELLRDQHVRYNKWLENVQNATAVMHAEQEQQQPQTLIDEILDLEPLVHSPEASHEGSSKHQRGKKLGSFFCQHHGVPGHLQITTEVIYFSPLYAGAIKNRSCITPLSEIDGLLKTNQHKLWLWLCNGLRISRRNRSPIHFTNMARRDDAFNLLLTIGSENWRKV